MQHVRLPLLWRSTASAVPLRDGCRRQLTTHSSTYIIAAAPLQCTAMLRCPARRSLLSYLTQLTPAEAQRSACPATTAELMDTTSLPAVSSLQHSEAQQGLSEGAHRHTHSGSKHHRHLPHQASPSEPYVFPVGRALRHVRRGQLFHQQGEGREEVQEWLSATTTDADDFLYDDGEEESTVLANTAAAVLEEASLFAKFHAHHVRIEFKKLRQRLLAEQRAASAQVRLDSRSAAKRGSEQRESTGSNGHRTASRTTNAPPATRLSASDAEALTCLLFAATVLLHVSGLYGVADTHVEPLLDVCFSASIFLAQDSAASAQQQQQQRSQQMQTRSARAAQTEKVSAASTQKRIMAQRGASVVECKASATHMPTPSTSAAALRQRRLHSLHWAVLHFSAAVQRWGLMEHAKPLQDVRKTQRPFARLLQAHAAILCDLTHKSVDRLLWHELLLLKRGGDRAPEARAAWFLGVSGSASSYAEWFDNRHAASMNAWPPRLQQRRLQLLPMLWLSLLASELAHPAPVPPPAGEEPARLLNSKADPSVQGSRLVNGSGAVTWGTARHAMTALLPLFQCEACLDVTAWAMLHILYLPRGADCSSREHTTLRDDASLTEVCALLARAEQDGTAQELAATLLSGTSTSASRPLPPSLLSGGASSAAPAPAVRPVSAEEQLQCLLAAFLRRWIDASTTAAGSVAAADGANAQGSTSARANTGTSHLSLLRAAPHTPIRSSRQLYRALLNVPLCTLRLPLNEKAHVRTSRDGARKPSRALPLPVTLDGVRLANSLLMRVLLQWRNGQAGSAKDAASFFAIARSPSSDSGEDAERVTVSSAHAGLDEWKEKEEEQAAVIAQVRLRQERCVAACAQWEKDVMHAVQAVHHLQQLMLQGSAVSSPSCTEKGPEAGQRGEALVEALVAPTARAAARAICEQLGASLLPLRRRLAIDGGAPLTRTELWLLRSLDEEVLSVLGYAASTEDGSDDHSVVGAVPGSYRAAMQELLQCSSNPGTLSPQQLSR